MWLCGWILILLIPFSTWCFASTEIEIAVIFSSDIDPYQQSYKGFKDYIAGEEITPLISTHYLQKQSPEIIIQQILTENPDLVLTIGPQATILAEKEIRKIPVIFSMILNYREINNSNSTGVYLDVPARVKLNYIKKILPDAKRVGVIYSSKSSHVFNDIFMECNKMNYKLIGKKVSTSKEFKNAFKEISGKIDSFLMIPDTKVYFSQSVKYLLLEGIRRKLPVIGLSSTYTKAGAFASLESDYYESGKQAATIALKIINGSKPASIKPIDPVHVKLSINLLVAERLGILIPSHIRKESSEVFGK
mgnify:CR=1 FL=1